MFGTHVRQGSNELSQIGLVYQMRVAVGRSCHTEIENLGLAGLIDQDVSRFEIAVNNAALMGVVNRFADPGRQFQALPAIQSLGVRILDERPATDQLHGKIWLRSGSVVSRAGFVDLRNARMLQLPKRQSFLLEAANQLRISQTGLDNL